MPATQRLNRYKPHVATTPCPKQGDKTRQVPVNLLAPPRSASTRLQSHPTLNCCSPFLMRDSLKAATVGVSCEGNNRLSDHKKNKKVQQPLTWLSGRRQTTSKITPSFPLPSRSQRRPTPPLSAAPPTRQRSGSCGVHCKALGGLHPYDRFSSRRIVCVCHPCLWRPLIFQSIIALPLPLG